MQRHLETSAASHTRIGDEVSVLSGIYRAEVNLAIWRRQQTPRVSAGWYEAAALSGISIRERVEPTLNRGEHLFSSLPAGDSRAGFCDDLRFITQVFADLTGATELGLRLETVDRGMCRFWHTDKVSLRLITTYFGPGTQWVANHDVWRDRTKQHSDGDTFLVLRPNAPVQVFEPFDVGVFKGSPWPAPHEAIVHRSPRVEPGARRLLLTLDPLA